MLQLEFQQILSQALSFLILLWLLKRFAWRPLLRILDTRRSRIEEGFRQLDQQKVELARLQRDLTKRLATIDEEGRARIQQAIQEGKRIAMEIQEEARAQAQGIIAKSKETIELELAKAQVSLRDALVDMTVEAVERLLQQKCDSKTDEKLVTAILEELTQADSHQA